ncbi:FliH/SctL family protein [Proteinivorax hydrogeniformans]|uniref:FliH/SctL family protein n=1 Tax=Proteinivorax hydrogeniformans TaxID=1826727 RepID=A0AAU8HQM1_9FIRM
MSNVIKSFNVKESDVRKIDISNFAVNADVQKQKLEAKKTSTPIETDIQKAKKEADQILRMAQKEKEDIYRKAKEKGFKEGYDKGFDEGRQVGMSDGKSKAEKLIAKTEDLLSQTESLKAELLIQAEKDILALTGFILEQVIGDVTSQDKNLIKTLYDKLSPLAKPRNLKEVIVSSANEQLITSYLEDIGDSNVRVVTDRQMRDDEIKVVTNQGYIPYNITALVNEIKEQLVN